MIVTLDFACFRLDEDYAPEVLLMRRNNPERPYHNTMALVGGWVWEEAREGSDVSDSNLDDATKRILSTKTGVTPKYIEALPPVGSVDRDPEGWSITIPHLCLLSQDDAEMLSESTGFSWVKLSDVREGKIELAFDHKDLIELAWESFARKCKYSSVALHLLPEKFLISDAIKAYAAVGIQLTRPTANSRVIDSGCVEDTGEVVLPRNGRGKPAAIYTLSSPDVVFFEKAIG